VPSYSETGSGGVRLGGTTIFVPPPLTTFRTEYIRQILAILDGGDLRVSWVSLELPGTWYQLYVNGQLTHWTQHLYTHISYPTTSEIFVVGAVPAVMAATDFSASLPPTPQRRIELTWLGGRYLALDIAGFNVYLGDAPGGAVDYTRIVATVPAYSGHQILDGYGEGGYGEGGYGTSATTYEWISDPVAAGTWNVAVKSIDLLGNESSSALTGSVVIGGPPEPPARDTGGSRLHYTYNASTQQVTLNWLASPSF